MLTGTHAASGTQSSQAPAARNAHPQGARKQEAHSPEALRFRESLQQQAGGKSDLPLGLRKGMKGQPEDLAQGLAPSAQQLQQGPEQQKLSTPPDDKSKVDGAGASQAEASAPRHAAEGAQTAARSGDLAMATLAGQFAERLALSPVSGGETQLMLDPSRFNVTAVTISGRAGEDLSFAYESGSGDREGSPDEQALRDRLEARGIKVGSVSRKT